ncbi:Flagellar protein [Phytophthora cinnamomi]|uniref:Flagellar protein n=1 Tax=Phytophthora cinnamomi TaxID=4785 RepID=UPI003559FAC4|nr:Flagellar protein [Phytophthora cinnamomi]
MADLLLRWLNHELELSTHVTDVEADFASGYLLGEILHRLNHQHDFADFTRSSSADAKILNFCLLEPTLRNLNIKFDANAAAAIMNEKKDAAANLLYQIKIAATRVGRAPAVSSKSLERTGIFPLHNRPVKLAKPSYDSENHRLFEHSVRRHVRSITSLQQEKDRIAEEATKRKAHLARLEDQKELLEATKAERLHRAYIHSSFIKEALEETDSPAWRQALQTKNAREQRRAAFFQQLMKKREEAEENLTFSLRRKVQNDLDDFYSNSDSESTRTGGKVSSRKSVGYGLRSLTTALGATSDKKKYSTSNLAGSSMNERELYHANMLEMESASGTARVTSILEDVVLRDTNSEKDVHGEMGRILTYKEVARENRLMRNQEYLNQQELDSIFEDDSEMQVLQRSNVRVSIEAAARYLSEQISAEIMDDMVKYEHDLMQRRVRFLQEATEKACDEVTRSMRSVEITLRDVLEERKDREQVAVADLVAFIRTAIEAEIAIPLFVDVSPDFIERFPTTVQLREDTTVRVNGDRRLLPRIPPDAPPIVEETHEVVLNPRQRDSLREALASQSCDNSRLIPLCTLVEIIAALTSQPDALPEVWRRCPAHAIAEIAAGFTMKQSAFVDIEALLTAMSTREDLLRQFQEDEAREELERQQQFELQRQREEQEREVLLQQQQEAPDNEPAPTDAVE